MSGKDKLVKEIHGLLKQLKKDDLLQIKHQVSVFLYNSTVEEMQGSAQITEPNQEQSQKTTKTKPKEPAIEIDQKEGSMAAFISTENRERVFFTAQELAKMLALCESAGEVRNIPTKVFNWLKQERMDFLNETGISSSRDPHIKELCLAILEKWGQ